MTSSISISTGAEATRLIGDLAQATGAHRVLLVGPTGCGKTMLARRIAAAMGAPTGDAGVASAWLFHGAGLCSPDDLVGRWAAGRGAPFRAPHHTCSFAAITGTAARGVVRPGELSLAHGGVLFLDDVAEFATPNLQAVVAFSSEGRVSLGRIEPVTLPSQPRLVLAATALCPCGQHGRSDRRCVCSPRSIERFRRRFVPFQAHQVVDVSGLDLGGLTCPR